MNTIIKKKFYHLFWNNPSCQNLFLLSKEELLETKTFGEDNSPYSFSTNRIIVSNAQLINTLNSEDNFQSRIKLFGELYDSKIISPTKDDAFIECSHCDPLTYRGVFQLRLNPKKLKDLKCPVCSNELTYFVPYELHSDIFNAVKSHDGLILDALQNKLVENGIQYELNKKFLNDIEIDCIFKDGDKRFFVETKMYKQNKTTESKLISKIKEHFSKLIKDIERIENNEEFKDIEIIPILLININSEKVLNITQQYFKLNFSENKYYENGKIINLNLLKFKS